jgi:hypothetical protein
MTTQLEQIISEKYELLKPFLDEQNKRLIAAAEAISLGEGGISIVSRATAVLHQLDPKIIYPHYDFKHLTEKYFEIGMKLNDFSIQLVKYCTASGPSFPSKLIKGVLSLFSGAHLQITVRFN